MNTQPIRQLLLIAFLVGALTACTPIVAPATTDMPTAETPTTTDAMPIESVDTEQCDSLQAALSARIGQELTKQEGTACTLVANGTGEEFGNFVDVAQSIREVFEADGWTEDETAISDGPTGTATSFFKDTTVAAVNVSWEPSEEANCPADQPISECDIEPSQQIFTISIDLVKIA